MISFLIRVDEASDFRSYFSAKVLHGSLKIKRFSENEAGTILVIAPFRANPGETKKAAHDFKSW
ncbi:MAG: hypothetical protein KAJ05_01200, partial [Candidatus Latescibacteria bacterium]|nr:hypothetical protein [Candidatus Latescibacterota bacterium]